MSRLRGLDQKLLFGKIIAGSLIFYIFSGVTSALNYAFYPLVARFVTVSQYGELQFLVTMFTQLSVGFIILNILTIIITATAKSTKRRSEATAALNFVASLATLVIVILGSLFLYGNQSPLRLQDDMGIITLGASLIISVPFMIAIGRLQGNGHFMASGAIITLGAFLKVVFSLIFIWLGWGVSGAVFGIAIGTFAALVITGLVDRQIHHQVLLSYSRGIKRRLRSLLFIKEQALVAVVTVTVVILLCSADSIVSRIILNPHEAGQYAAIATLAKVIFAVTSPIMWLALPPAVTGNRSKIINLIALTLLTSAVICVLYSIFPSLFIGILGVNAGSYHMLLPLASIAMASCSVAFMFVCIGICLGALRPLAVATIMALPLYFVGLELLSPAMGLLYASLYCQILVGSIYILSCLPPLRRRNFEQILT